MRLVRWLTVVHRWLGLVFCLVFLTWFASGLVMVFHRMPEYSTRERLSRLPPLEANAIRIPPLAALRAADLSDPPQRVVLTTLRGRPVYRFLASGEWTSVYADTGRIVDAIGAVEAVAIVRGLFGSRAVHATLIDTIDTYDQWTFELPFQRLAPLHRVSLGDAAGTIVYVSEVTGDVVLTTDRASRAWGYAGPVLHWFYFRPLRVRGPLWANLIIYGSLAGCLVALAGLVIGFTRFSMSRRFKGGTSASPYVGWLRWHHYAGLMFGVLVFSWTFSGLLSMSPWDWSPGNSPAPAQVAAIRGRGIDPSRFGQPPAAALQSIGAGFRAREIELRQFLGTPYYLATRPGASRLVQAATGEVHDRFSRDELLRAARAAMPGLSAADVTWLTAYDAYYYGRGGDRPLPVLRVRFSDPDETWLYLDAHDGSLVQREVRRSRVERWLYHGFHSLDFPWLYQTAWAWYPLILTLCAGGLVVSVTSVMMGWRVLRRARPLSRGRRGHRAEPLAQ